MRIEPSALRVPRVFAITAVLTLHPAMVRAEVIFEDKGLYKKETWNVERYYDDLSNPNDKPGVLTSGKDPKNPSGPAVDFEQRPGTMTPAPDRGERNDGKPASQN